MASYQQSKSLAIVFLVGAFLAGGGVVYAADRAMTKRPYMRQMSKQQFRDAFAAQLGLRPEQRVVVDSIFEWRGKRHQEIRNIIKPAIDSLYDSARVSIMQHLDSTQRVRFQAMLDSSNATRDSVRRAAAGDKR